MNGNGWYRGRTVTYHELFSLVMNEGGDCDYEGFDKPPKPPKTKALTSCVWRKDDTGFESARSKMQ